MAFKKDVELLKREIEIMKSIDHPNITKFYEFYHDEKFFHLVIEYCSGGDLISKIIEQSNLTEEFTKRIIF